MQRGARNAAGPSASPLRTPRSNSSESPSSPEPRRRTVRESHPTSREQPVRERRARRLLSLARESSACGRTRARSALCASPPAGWKSRSFSGAICPARWGHAQNALARRSVSRSSRRSPTSAGSTAPERLRTVAIAAAPAVQDAAGRDYPRRSRTRPPGAFGARPAGGRGPWRCSRRRPRWLA
jgi:hypothetical protein